MDRSQPRRQLVWVAITISAVLATLLIYRAVNSGEGNSSEAQTTTTSSIVREKFEDKSQEISFEYISSELTSKQLSEQDKKDNIIARYSGTNTPMQLYVQYEKDLAKVSNLTRREPLDVVLSNSDKVFPQKFPNYKEMTERRFEFEGKEAAEIIFTYTGNNQKKIKQRFLVVIKDQDTAFYMIGQTGEETFETINREIFEPTFQSFRV